MANAKITLYYFDGKCRAEVARLILTAAGKEFADITFPFDDWPKYEPMAPFGKCPFIKLDDEIYCESLAINSFLASEFGFHGKTNLESLKIEQITHMIEDLMKACVHVPHIETEEGRQKEMDRTKVEVSPRFLNLFEKLLQKNGTGYFVGDRLTLADIAVFDVATGMLGEYVDINDSYPLLQKHVETVRAHSKIGPYLLSRPKTFF